MSGDRVVNSSGFVNRDDDTLELFKKIDRAVYSSRAVKRVS